MTNRLRRTCAFCAAFALVASAVYSRSANASVQTTMRCGRADSAASPLANLDVFLAEYAADPSAFDAPIEYAPVESVVTTASGWQVAPRNAENITAPLSADFDGNSQINNLDFSKWSGDFGVNGGSDADGDGMSTGFDFLVWQTQSGRTMDADIDTAHNPEPAALAVWTALASLAGLLYARRRQRP